MKPSRHRREGQLAYALGATAGTLPPGVVISRMDLLRRSGRDEAALDHLRETVARHPSLAVGLLATLRAAGRQADIGLVLDVIASTDPQVCSRVAAALTASRDADDLRLLLDRLQQRGLAELAVVAVAYEEASSLQNTATVVNPIAARLLTWPVQEICAGVRDLRRRDRDRDADALLAAFSHAGGPTVREAALLFARQGMRAEASTVLHGYALAAEPLDLAECYSEVARSWVSAAALLAPVMVGRKDCARLLAAMHSVDPSRFPGILIERLSPQHMARLCALLSAQDAPAELDAVLTWCAGCKDAAAVRAVLHDSGLHALGYRLAERADEVGGTPGL